MSQLERLATSLLKIAEQIDNSSAKLNQQMLKWKLSKEANTPAGHAKVIKMQENSNLLIKASLHLRHAANELKQIKE